VALSLVALASCRPQQQFDEFGNVIEPTYRKAPQIRLISSRNVQDGKGNYEFSYEQDNGQKVQEVGRSYPGDKPETGSITKEGSYEWEAPDQKTYRVEYQAGEQGFDPRGDHLPKVPAQIPEYRLLQEQHPELFVGAFWLNN